MVSVLPQSAKFRIDGLKLASKLNQRVHWSVRAKQAKRERGDAYYTVRKFELPCLVKIIRVGPRALDDDNLAGACKSIRDGIADRLGVDDRSPAVAYRYAQRIGPYAVEIEIMTMPEELRVQCLQENLI